MGRRRKGAETQDSPAAPASARGPLLVIVTVVLCLPVIRLVLDGQVPATSAAERSAVAVVLAWAAIGGIGRMVDTYRARNASRGETAGAPGAHGDR